jgi:hypothetical protein
LPAGLKEDTLADGGAPYGIRSAGRDILGKEADEQAAATPASLRCAVKEWPTAALRRRHHVAAAPDTARLRRIGRTSKATKPDLSIPWSVCLEAVVRTDEQSRSLGNSGNQRAAISWTRSAPTHFVVHPAQQTKKPVALHHRSCFARPPPIAQYFSSPHVRVLEITAANLIRPVLTQ